MFLLVCVILFTGGVCLSACWDTIPPGSRHTPLEQTHPLARRPPWQGDLPARRPPLWQRDPPGKETPWQGDHPSGKETPLLARRPPLWQGDPPSGKETPLARRPPSAPWQGDPPSGKETPPPQHTVNERPVRILLECILVFHILIQILLMMPYFISI